MRTPRQTLLLDVLALVADSCKRARASGHCFPFKVSLVPFSCRPVMNMCSAPKNANGWRRHAVRSPTAKSSKEQPFNGGRWPKNLPSVRLLRRRLPHACLGASSETRRSKAEKTGARTASSGRDCSLRVRWQVHVSARRPPCRSRAACRRLGSSPTRNHRMGHARYVSAGIPWVQHPARTARPRG
jgi:hypothetical protein